MCRGASQVTVIAEVTLLKGKYIPFCVLFSMCMNVNSKKFETIARAFYTIYDASTIDALANKEPLHQSTDAIKRKIKNM